MTRCFLDVAAGSETIPFLYVAIDYEITHPLIYDIFRDKYKRRGHCRYGLPPCDEALYEITEATSYYLFVRSSPNGDAIAVAGNGYELERLASDIMQKFKAEETDVCERVEKDLFAPPPKLCLAQLVRQTP